MKQYDVEITETLQRTISVEANSREEALTKVKKRCETKKLFWIQMIILILSIL